MRRVARRLLRGRWGMVWGLVGCGLWLTGHAETVIYFTDFEAPDYRATNVVDGEVYAEVLDGQQGWLADPTGPDQLFNQVDALLGPGQQALLGAYPPAGDFAAAYLWHPLDFDPIAAGLPRVTFTVRMAIYDSTTAKRDLFFWDVYNIYEEQLGLVRLFSIAFDNRATRVGYQLEEDEDPRWGPISYVHGGYYTLTVEMDFAHNRWSARLRGEGGQEEALATDQPITTRGSKLDLGDIDAVWYVGTDLPFGDDFMVFDDYRVVADLPSGPTSSVEGVGFWPGMGFLVRVVGEPGRQYDLEASADFSDWQFLAHGIGTFDFLDTEALGHRHRYYRAIWAPPGG